MGVAGTSGRCLTVASWNLHEGLPSAGGAGPCSPAAMDEVVGLLTDRGVGIAAFQEVGFDDRGRSELLESVRRRTPLRYVASYPLHDSSFFPGRLSGVAVASRFEVRTPRQYMLPNPRLRTRLDGKEIQSHDKGLVSVAVPLWGTTVNVTSLHAVPFYLFGRDPDEAEFKEIWDALAGELGRRATGRLSLVCGDFNTDNRGLVLSSDSLSLNSSFEGRPTYRNKSIDDILHGPGFTFDGAELIDNFSDHRACVATFRVAADVLRTFSEEP
ncbi:endonuclease/exonuclease/phosphatase family protein [Streptomyces diastatochromogenes]|nr:endonuclease/exonuclease/phosphatase family protein [Streptomyces diastatochromogenes]MCZ0987285.1 endonuclease/exonuclease/phosphatase family protein [Streptomyces diastatochromogenes]